MRKINLLLLFIVVATTHSYTQTVIWTEAFQNNCASGCFATAYTGPNGTWTQTNTGTNDPEANAWFISGNECGNAAGACGSTCGIADPSLHIGANDGFTTTDPGASYNAGGLCGILFCVVTDRRVESPTINLTGQSNITINFNYMENGQTTIDNATLWYFNGTVWSQLFDLAKTVLCGVQGTWTAYSQLLPASANNNPNVKIGFRWINNDDGVGTDPSFAVDDITLTVPTTTGPTASFTTSSNTVCVGSTITFTNTSTTSGTTTYSWIFPTGTPATANTVGPHTVTFNTPGIQNISLTVTDVNGTNNAVVPITVIAPPTIAVAGPPQTVCATTATLAGNTPTIGTGTWTLVSGAGTITTPTSPTSGVTGLGVGANVFQWTITNAPCPPSTSTVTINRTAPPTTSVAGPAQTVCSTTATLAGNTPTVGTGTWTLVSGAGTITTPTSPTSGVTGLGVGANVFQWTITNAPCPPSTSTVTITGIAPQVANAGPNQATCNTTATLAGNTPTAGTGTWTLISGAGTITTPTSPTSGVTGLGLGANVFQWTISNPPCTPSISTVTITVNNCSQPTASFNASALSVCVGSSITFTDNSTGTGISAWSWTFPTGTPATANTQGPHIVTFNTPGTQNINLQVTDANGIDDTTIVITVVASPTVAAAGPNQAICNTTATLAGNTPTVGTGTWTLISGTGTITNPSSPTSGVTGLGLGANVFQWTITNAPCPPSTSTVTINVNNCSQPTASFNASALSVCVGNSITFTDNSTGTGISAWSWTFPTGTPATANTQGPHTVTFNTPGAQNINLQVTDANGMDDTTIVITVIPNATSTDVQTACNSFTWIDGITYTTSTNLPTVTLIGGAASGCDSIITLNLTITTPTKTTNVLNECEGFSVTVGTNTYTTTGVFIDVINNCDTIVTNLTINPAPQFNLVKTDALCFEETGTASATITSANFPVTFSWSTGGTDSIITNLAEGVYTLTLIDSNGCSSIKSIEILNEQQDCDFFVYLPNAFTPNGDGNNDVFFVNGKGIVSMNLKIYNRWGNKVFETTEQTQVWDGQYKGKNQDTGTFMYVLEAAFVNGKTINQSGDVSLVR